MTLDVDSFYDRQLSVWPEAAEAYERLDGVMTRSLGRWHLQCNPQRIRSTSARVDGASVASRPCFLCAANRPECQLSIPDGDYEVLVNPFPILPRHLTIASRTHTPQSASGRVADMLRFASALPGFTVFFNGAQCGASAPDHLHFQAVPSAEIPLWESVVAEGIGSFGPVGYFHYSGPDAVWLAERLVRDSSMVNILARVDGGGVPHVVVIPRRAHRPRCFHEGRLMVSPASLDVAGVMVLPRPEDFEAMTQADLDAVLAEVCFTPSELQPQVRVGIMTAPEIHHTDNSDGSFTLRDVVIGKQFHWERREDQTFTGSLELLRGADGQLTAINRLPVEDYLLSVISSEMSATASREFLCAHAVISRSWLLAQIDRSRPPYRGSCIETPEERVKWYDHDDHTDFDVCADDHCQRYQGITRATTPQVAEALAITAGQVLTYDGAICDARFSKCCGGVMEEFSTCWQPVDVPYLRPLRDAAVQTPVPNLTTEEGTRRWILGRPEAFCATESPEILSMVLNSYDRETTDFYRWRVDYTADELADIVRSRSGIDFGHIIELNPLHRGPSGRIDRLEIVGTLRRMVIGKELEIRRTLSRSHLYSSAFIIEAQSCDAQCVPSAWTLRGAGWGHGVGLCQIGAAVMAEKGYSYTRILAHYFPGASITKMY